MTSFSKYCILYAQTKEREREGGREGGEREGGRREGGRVECSYFSHSLLFFLFSSFIDNLQTEVREMEISFL